METNKIGQRGTLKAGLDVHLFQCKVGTLFRDEIGRLTFVYDAVWLENANAIPLSQSLPLTSKQFTQKECQGYFSGLLPEGMNRNLVARNLKVRAKSDIILLELLGLECAGAVWFTPSENTERPTKRYLTQSDAELAEMLKMLPQTPLFAGEKDVRHTLAGAQDKVAVYVDGTSVSLPQNGALTTHILKPDHDRFPGLVHNEDFCMKLAAAVGLSVAKTEARTAGGADYLLIERYDRQKNEVGELTCLHQEDFCQAMAIRSENKYPGDGGPGFIQCFKLLDAASTAPTEDSHHFMAAVIFNFLIGNNDAHGKNFSLLYGKEGPRLAPLYDLIATNIYPDLTRKMAMKIARHKEFPKIFPRHFSWLAETVGLDPTLVVNQLGQLASQILEAMVKMNTDHPVKKNVSRFIAARCEGTLSILEYDT